MTDQSKLDRVARAMHSAMQYEEGMVHRPFEQCREKWMQAAQAAIAAMPDQSRLARVAQMERVIRDAEKEWIQRSAPFVRGLEYVHHLASAVVTAATEPSDPPPPPKPSEEAMKRAQEFFGSIHDHWMRASERAARESWEMYKAEFPQDAGKVSKPFVFPSDIGKVTAAQKLKPSEEAMGRACTFLLEIMCSTHGSVDLAHLLDSVAADERKACAADISGAHESVVDGAKYKFGETFINAAWHVKDRALRAILSRTGCPAKGEA